MHVRYHGDGSRPFPCPSDTIVLGLCTGSLAAAAISTSTTIVDLIPAAVEAVLTAFRIGLCSMEVRDVIQQSSPSALPAWSVIVGMEENQALTELNAFSATKVTVLKISKMYRLIDLYRVIREPRGHT